MTIAGNLGAAGVGAIGGVVLNALYVVKRAKIGNVTITCSVHESHMYSAQVTDHPMEVGSDVSDHRVVDPFILTLDGVISDATTDVLQDLLGSIKPGSSVNAAAASRIPVEVAYQRFLDMFKAASVLTVVTSLASYERMVFTRFGVTRDKDTNTVLSFSAELKQVTFVKSQTITALAFKAAAEPVDLGKKPTEPLSAAKVAKDQNTVALDGLTAGYEKVKKLAPDLVKAVVGQ